MCCGEVEIAQQQRDCSHALQVDGDIAFDDGALGNASDRGVIDCFHLANRALGVAPQCERPLRLGIDLSVRSAKRCQQKHTALDAAGIA